MTMEQQFRSAAFGGFYKQDVLNYIETSVREHAQLVEELDLQMEALRVESEDAAKRAAAAEQRVAELEPRVAQMEKLTAELESKRSLLAAAEREIRELKAQLADTLPKAEAYDAVKERTAGIELEAHQRARQVVDQAETQSRQIREQTLSWLNRVRSSYERLRTDISATITRTAGELDRAGKALAESNGEFRSHDAAMQEVANSLKKAEQTARGGRDATL